MTTEGPYYGQLHLVQADDRRMMKLEKTQLVHDITFCTIFTTALVLWLCSLL